MNYKNGDFTVFNSNYEEFLSKCESARELILSFEKPLIVHHYDADGIASGAVVSLFLDENKIHHKLMCIRRLDSETFSRLMSVISSGDALEVIFVDLGANSQFIYELNKFVVIDHHQQITSSSKLLSSNKIIINAMQFGYDGGTDISASTTAYFVCKTGLEVAITGAVGDMQYPLRSLNKLILDQNKMHVNEKEDLLLYGKSSRNLVDLLCYSTEPYLPGLTGDYIVAKKFVEEQGFDPSKTYYMLTQSEKTKFVSELVKFLYKNNSAALAKRLVGPVYTFSKYEVTSPLYDAHEFSTLLNACGRHNMPEVGIGICKNDVMAMEQGLKLLETHRKMLSQCIGYAYKNQIEFDNFFLIDGRNVINDTLIGTVCGMLNVRDKPIIGISLDEKGQIKVSGRGTKYLVDSGLNLGEALSAIAAELGGIGGGHKIAAGATFSQDKLNKFFYLLNEKLKQQLTKNSSQL